MSRMLGVKQAVRQPERAERVEGRSMCDDRQSLDAFIAARRNELTRDDDHDRVEAYPRLNRT